MPAISAPSTAANAAGDAGWKDVAGNLASGDSGWLSRQPQTDLPVAPDAWTGDEPTADDIAERHRSRHIITPWRGM